MAFVGSPLEVDANEFTKLAKRLRKEKVSIDIVIFGEEVSNEPKHQDFPSAIVLVFSRKVRRVYHSHKWQREHKVTGR